MKRFCLLCCWLFITSCGSSVIELAPANSPSTDTEKPPHPVEVDTTTDKIKTTCNWWETGCEQQTPLDDLFNDPEKDPPDDETDIDIPPNPPIPLTLFEQLVGIWHGEYQWDTGSKRLLYMNLQDTGTLNIYINPYGPSKQHYYGTWRTEDDTLILQYETTTLKLYNVTVTQNKKFTYTEYNQTTPLTMQAGELEPPEEGLFARIYAYSEDDESKMFHSSWGFFGAFDTLYWDNILFAIRGYDSSWQPRCSDFAYGVTSLNFSGKDFSTGKIPGFDRYGGTSCNVKDRFIIDAFGSLLLPPGISEIRFNIDSKEIDDAAILFLDDDILDGSDVNNVAVALQEYNDDTEIAYAALCNADSYYTNCKTDDSEPIYEIDAGNRNAVIPIEVIYIEKEDNVRLDIELSIGATNNFKSIPPELLTYPTWGDWRD